MLQSATEKKQTSSVALLKTVHANELQKRKHVFVCVCVRELAHPDELQWEGPSGVLRDVDGGDDPVPLHALQQPSDAVVRVSPRKHDLLHPLGRGRWGRGRYFLNLW